MRKVILAASLLVAVLTFGPAQEAPNVVETKPLSPADEVKRFTLPPGFEA